MTEALSAFKYVIFFLVMLIGVPLGYSLSLKHDKIERAIFFLMVFFTAKMEDINFVPEKQKGSLLRDLKLVWLIYAQ